MLSIKEVKDVLTNNPTNGDLEIIANDQRKGAQTELKKYYLRIEKSKKIDHDFLERKKYEIPLWKKNKIIAGVDEVGRGPLAGPVVTAAVILPEENTLKEINDSKQLTDKKRRIFYQDICEQALDISIGIGSPELIDAENIYHATELVMKQAVEGLNLRPNYLLVDAMTIPVDIQQQKIIKGDANSVSIAAASIVAKEIRDDIMKMYDVMYPGYGFNNNAGYGTKIHLEGLAAFGITPIHRKTFAPVKNML